MMKKEKRHTAEDTRLQDLLQKELPLERRDEWFTRKVMNRLPEKERPLFSTVEKVTFAVTALLLIGGWIWLWRETKEAAISQAMLVETAAVVLATLAWLGYLIVPALRRG
ncbi:MAG: hypothetical protein LIP02_05760 [Bacteroidales bacterium]|nr:hypothetical protein [Bacteroidales bacterium]